MRRILVVSSTYVDPANRGKLRALAARDLDVTVGVPQRWREAGLGRTLQVGWERQSGVEVFPIPVTGSGKADRLRYAGRALASLLRDKRPDLVQVEEEPGTKAALQVVGAARRPKNPAVLATGRTASGSRPWRASCGSRPGCAGPARCHPTRSSGCGRTWTCWWCRRAATARGPRRRCTWWRKRWRARSP